MELERDYFFVQAPFFYYFILKGEREMQLMTGFALAGVFICIGILFRVKIKFLREMLVPATVIAGVLGCLFMNFVGTKVNIGVDAGYYTKLVDGLFILSFVSIGLTKTKKEKSANKADNAMKSIASGSMGMGLLWCIVYGLTAAIGIIVISIVGVSYDMNPIYGMLIPFGFCEGPGLAASFGAIFEEFGWQDATEVGMTFSVIGFLCAFIAGVPLAKLGIKKKIAKNTGVLSESVAKGFYTVEEQRESIGKVTTYSGSIETLTFHFAIMAISYVSAVLISKLVGLIPGSVGVTLSGLVFMYGLISSYIIKFIMNKLNIEHLHNTQLQVKITGLMSDFLVVCAFMTVQFSVVSKWMVPIAIECLVVLGFTIFMCIFFGQRLGSDHDFERTLGVFGSCTGTVPSGIALVRMVDPRLATPVAVELGLMNLPELIYVSLAGIVMFSAGAGSMSFIMLILCIGISSVVMLVIMKMIGAFGSKTYSFNDKWRQNNMISEDESSRIKGKVVEE